MRALKYLSALALLCFPSVASSQSSYPDHAIRYIIPFQAGSSLDIVGRVVAEKLSTALGQPVVVENRAGAGGNLGANLVVTAKPDGYTLLHTINSLAAAPGLDPNLPFDPVKDLAPVVGVAFQPFMIVVSSESSYKTVQDIIDRAKAEPGKVAFGSSGTGSLDHLAGELFNSMAGTKMTHVPYKGGPAVHLDIIAGRIDFSFAGLASGLPNVRAGKLRAVAVTTTKRNPVIPDVPTVAESGIPNFEVVNSSAIYAPANTPKEIVARLNAEVNKILTLPEVRERFTALGIQPIGGTPEQLGQVLKADVAEWTDVIKKAGISSPN